MRFSKGLAAIVVAGALLAGSAPATAQYQPPSSKLLMQGTSASTWSDDPANVVQLDGPVTIELDRARATADRAVIWLTPLPGGLLDQQRAEIALFGNATIEQDGIVRSGEQLILTAPVRGTIRITADQRLARDLSDTAEYQAAEQLRATAAPEAPEFGQLAEFPTVSPVPATQPTTAPAQLVEWAALQFGNFETIETDEGKVAAVVSGGMTLLQKRATGDQYALRAQRAVIFTPVRDLRELGEGERTQAIAQAAEAVYLEGDVRITFTPAASPSNEQQLRAERIFYDFTTDRAVLTDAVLNTVEPTRAIPIVVRAKVLRQLSRTDQGTEYSAEKAEISTSSFATPSYSIRADKAYIRQENTADPRLGRRTTFNSSHNTLNFFGLPIFYLPAIGGSVTQHGFPLRSLSFENSGDFGFGVMTEWGLFESIGQPPPPGLDMYYRVGYYSERGVAGGLGARYAGGFITETTRDPWNFSGSFDSFVVDDHGEDDLGRRRRDIEQDEVRGHVYWEHQHFIPDDWQVQLRGGYVSDPSFLEEWFEDDFDTGQPHDLSLYLKRQRQTEAFTLAANVQPNDFVTTSEMQQEQFEVERLPEFGYHRIGDSVLGDQLTFVSNNRVGALRFNPSDATLAEQGFRGGQSAGLPATGWTGVEDDTTYRGDFRQEISAPFSAGQFRVVPYVMGRYTAYSDSPEDGSIDRLYAGTGVRLTTAFWKVNNAAKSELFDIHRIRHVIEPQVHLYTSVQSEDRGELFIYDEQVDAINDISAAQVALRQRWQTKRGGPGRWRSVDFFTLNIEGNFFANQPPEDELEPLAFRGLFFDSLPEASIPRNSVNVDALWRVSDSFAVLADAQYNLDESELATASIGIAVRRDDRLAYYLGNRYIEELDSNLTSFSLSYDLTTKYTLGFAQSVDFGVRENIRSAVSLTRRFDRFLATFRYGYDHSDDDQSFSFAIYPTGLGFAGSTSQLGSIFRD